MDMSDTPLLQRVLGCFEACQGCACLYTCPAPRKLYVSFSGFFLGLFQSKLVSPFFFSDIARALHTKTKKLSELQIGNLIRSVSRLSNRNCNEQLRDYSKQCLLQFEGRAALLPQPIILAMKVFARHDPSFAAKCLLDIAAEDLPEFFIPILEAVKGDTALLAVYYLRLLDIAKKEMSVSSQLSAFFLEERGGGYMRYVLCERVRMDTVP